MAYVGTVLLDKKDIQIMCQPTVNTNELRIHQYSASDILSRLIIVKRDIEERGISEIKLNGTCKEGQ